MSQDMHTRTTELPAERGNIYTEDGQLLCSTIPQFDVRIDFSVIDSAVFEQKIDSLSMCMSELFGDASKEKYKAQLSEVYEKKKRYYLLKKKPALLPIPGGAVVSHLQPWQAPRWFY